MTLGGWVADGAVTLPVGGESNAVADSLMETTKQSLFDAVAQCTVGNHLGDVGHAVEVRVEDAGFSVIRELIGHGVGRQMHEEPQVPNYGPPGRGASLPDVTPLPPASRARSVSAGCGRRRDGKF